MALLQHAIGSEKASGRWRSVIIPADLVPRPTGNYCPDMLLTLIVAV